MAESASDKRRTDPVKGKKVNFRPLGRIWSPPLEQVTSVACVPFLPDGRMVAVKLRDRGLDIPGGHVQVGDKDLEAAARRELQEEACIRVGRVQLAEVIESDYYGTEPADLTYMVTLGAFVEDLEPFEANDEAEGREIVPPSEFFDLYKNKDGLPLMRGAVEAAWSALTNAE